MDETRSGSCSVTGFGICDTVHSGPITIISKLVKLVLAK